MPRRVLSLSVLLIVLLLAGAVTGLLLWQGGEDAPSPSGLGPTAAAAGSTGVIDEAGTCLVCGMRVEPGDRWGAEVVFKDGSKRVFCTPRCMVAYVLKWLKPEGQENRPGRAALLEMKVAGHYDGRPLDARRASFIVGSDVVGPMGTDFVPVASPEQAAELIRDHGGRVVTFDQIDLALFEQVVAGAKP